jgi:carbonic anhydrase
MVQVRSSILALNGFLQWNRDVAKLHDVNERHLSLTDESMDERSKNHRLEEVYVLAEVDWLKRQPNVKEAIRDRGLQIHAFVYQKENNKCVRLVETAEGGSQSRKM